MPAPRESEKFAGATFHAFERAYAELPARREFGLSVARRGVALRYAAPVLEERFRPALSHLETEMPATTDLEICCWDRAVTRVTPPPPPWGLDDYLVNGRIRGYIDGRVRATFDATSRVLSLYDRERKAAIVHVADASIVPRWFDRAPFRTILTWWAADRGLALLHASAVARGDSAVAIAGTSGAGKSTTALACLAAGMDFIGDDACLIELDPDVVAYSVFRLAKLEPDALERLPSLAALVTDRHDEQTLIDPGVRHTQRARLRTILLPCIVDAPRTRVVPVPPALALRTLVPSTLLEGGGLVRDALGTLTRLAQTVPCFRLELSVDLDDVAATVRRVLDGEA